MALVGSVLITAAVLLSIFVWTQRRASESVSSALIASVTQASEDHVALFFKAGEDATTLTLDAFESGALNPSDPEALERHFFGLLKVYPDLVMLSYGDADGHFIIVVPQEDGAVDTKRIDGLGPSRSVRWLRRDPGDPAAVVRSVEQLTDPYDPRSRPWYRAAADRGRPVWIDPYVFYTERFPGMTLAAPYRTDGVLHGVMTADFRLTRLNAFLAGLPVGQHGFAVLLDAQGQLLADPHGEPLDDADGSLTLRPASRSHNPALAALASTASFAAAIAGAIPGPARFQVQGDPWLGQVRPVQVGHTTLLLAVLLPESDVLGEVQQANGYGLLASLLFGVLALLTSLAVSERISGSLRVLVAQSRAVAKLSLDEPPSASSPFREVSDVLDAFSAMRAGLRSFRKYLPVELVQSLLASRQEARLGAELREVTLFFSDVTGFTSISEQLPPMEMAVLLGEYLGLITEIIEAHDGTVVQYIGDAVMAFWGAPHQVDDHPGRACEAALACQQAISALRGGQDPVFHTRIGLHTVEVAVGHFGSERRLYYGALGDGVNTAARLEGINKPYATQIMVGAPTWARVRDRFEGRRVDRVVVKGRSQPLDIYELVGAKGAISPERSSFLRAYEAAFDHYLAGDWSAAIRAFSALGNDDQATVLLLDRCRSYLASPPTQWDGVHIMHSKK